MRGKRKRGGCKSGEALVERRQRISQPREIHAIEAALKFVRGIGLQPGDKRAGRFAAKKTSVRFANCNRAAREFRLTIKLLNVQWREHNFRDAQSPVRGDSRDGSVAPRIVSGRRPR